MQHIEEIVLRLKDQFSRSLGSAEKGTKRVRKQTQMLDNQVKRLQRTALGAFGAFSAFQGIKSVVDLGIEIEQTRIAFTTFIGDAERANSVINDLQQFANVTPFTNTEVLKSAKSLMAYGVEANKILPAMDSLGNIAAGVGTDKLPQLITAFGQVKAATRLTGMELRQFTETGVPLLDALAKQTGKSVSYIKETMISKGMVSFEMVQKALSDMSGEGGKFFNLMEKQSQSLGGRISTLKGKVQLFAMSIGETLLPQLKAVTEKIMGFTEWVVKNKAQIAVWVPGIAKLIGIVGGLLGVMKLWTIAQGLLNLVMTANPIGLIIVGVGALIAIFTVWREEIMNVINSNSLLGDVLAILFMPISLMIDLIKSLYTSIKTWFTTSEKGIFIIDVMRKKIHSLADAVRSAGDWFRDLPNKALSAFDTIKKKLRGFVDSVVGAFKVITNPFDDESRAEGLKQLKKGYAAMAASGSDNAFIGPALPGAVNGPELPSTIKSKRNFRGMSNGLANLTGASSAAKGGVSAGIAGVTSSAPKNVTISFGNLVEEFNVNTTTLKEGTAKIREEITKALLMGINDAQIQAG